MALTHASTTPEAFVAQMQGTYNYELECHCEDNKNTENETDSD
jgi:hypothetical protein